MGGAVGIAANNDSNAHIIELWDIVSRFEDASSMRALDYPPHFTFAIYQDIDMSELRDVIRDILSEVQPISITFDKIQYFDASPLILWASPKDSSELAKLHTIIHAEIDPSLCAELYRPQHWIAHCTLGNRIEETNRAAALSFASEHINPFQVIFDTIDVIEFPPNQITERIVLTA